MEKYDFFYGSQLVEFERPEVPEIVGKEGIEAEMVGSQYNLLVNTSKTKAVILNVCDKRK